MTIEVNIEMPAIATVYALSDPLKPSVIRYIGSTTRSLSVRLVGHLREGKSKKKSWIDSLLRGGREPSIWPLEEVSVENSEERERYWISFFLPLGKLLNTTHVFWYKYVRIKGLPDKKRQLSREDVLSIRNSVLNGKMSVKESALKYRTSITTMYRAAYGLTYKDVK